MHHAQAKATDGETVVLLHGLARTRYCMRHLGQALEQQGYRVINLGYPSTRYPVERLATKVIGGVIPDIAQAGKVHFVTHSMGGILLRCYLAQHSLPNLGRVVMLGPPNQGSELVDRLKGWRLFRWLNGPAGSQLGTDSQSIPVQLGEVDFPLGVIAGNKSYDFILSPLLPCPNDGKVSVASTQVNGMIDHLVLPVTHTFMMNSPGVIEQVIHFLRFGMFHR